MGGAISVDMLIACVDTLIAPVKRSDILKDVGGSDF